MFTDDPIRDFYRHDAEQEAKLEKLPVCQSCGEPIQDEFLYCVNDEILCTNCMNYSFRVATEDFME